MNLQRDVDGLADTEMVARAKRAEADAQRAQEAAAPASGSSPSRSSEGGSSPSRSPEGRRSSRGRSHHPPGSAYERVLGQQDAERYGIIGEHARGGLGRIIKARDERLGRTVAIKELLKTTSFAESLFIREALITARLQHPGIVPVHEAGRWPSGEPFYVMKLVSGMSLQEIIRDKHTLAERMEIVPNVIAVAETIAYAHSERVIHRDIKPANIIVGDYGETVVVDWGLARDDKHEVPLELPGEAAEQPAIAGAATATGSGATPGSVWLTTGNYSISGKVVGTPAYMAPEQARGEDVDERADVYAIGALLYEVLSGRPPYPGRELQVVLERVLAGPPKGIKDQEPAIPPDLVTVVNKAMARDPDQRYPTAKELAADLKRFQTGQLVSAHQYSAWTLIKRWAWRHRSTVAVAVAGLVALAVGGVVSFRHIVEARDHADEQRVVAEAAKQTAESQRNDLLLLQAESLVDRDPTATVAWLKRVPLAGEAFYRARHLYERAIAGGVARHVIWHPVKLGGAAFTPDGELIFSADMDGAVRVIEVDTGRHRIFARTHAPLSSVHISPDGKLLAAINEDGQVMLWELARGPAEPIRTIQALVPNQGSKAVFSADSRRFAMRSDSSIAAWDIATGKQLFSFDSAGGAAFAPDGSQILVVDRAAAANRDGEADRDSETDRRGRQTTLRLIDATDGRSLRTLEVSGRVLGLELAPDTQRAAILMSDGRIYIANLGSGVLELLGTTKPERFAMMPFLFSQDGRRLVMQGRDWSIWIWDLDSRELRELRGHENALYSLVFVAGESLLASASDDGTVRLWDLGSDNVRVLRGHRDDVFDVQVSPRGNVLASLSFDNSLRIWPVELGLGQLLATMAERALVAEISFSGGSGGSIVTIDRTGTYRRWDTVTGQSTELGQAASAEVRHLPLSRALLSADGRQAIIPGDNGAELTLVDVSSGETRVLSGGHEAAIKGASFSLDGRALVSLDLKNRVIVWSLDSSAATPVVLGRDAPFCSVQLAPDGTEVAIVTLESVELWSVASQERQHVIPRAGGAGPCFSTALTDVVYSPDGRFLAVKGARRGLALWSRHDHTLEQIDSGIFMIDALGFSPDGSLIGASSVDRSVHVWETATRRERVKGYHDDLIYTVVFSPDGRTLASSSYDRTIRLWDTRSGRFHELRGHNNSVDRIAFSPDGKTLVSSSRDRTIRLWDVERDPVSDRAALIRQLGEVTTAEIDEDYGAPRSREPQQGDGTIERLAL